MRSIIRAGVVALALVSPAAATQLAEAAPDGAAAYAQACAECHRTPARFMRRYLEMPPAERSAALDRFLPTHYAPDPAQRAAIIAWLMQYQPAR
jgi:mono/diheme cytochrome c family protein